MLKVTVLAIVLVSFVVLAEPNVDQRNDVGAVDRFNKDFSNLVRSGNFKAILDKHIVQHTILRCYTVLPFGGLYQGNEEIETFHTRLHRFMNVSATTYNVALSNIYNGYTVADMSVQGQRIVENTAANNPNLAITVYFKVMINWLMDGKIKRVALISLDDLALYSKILTKAETLLHQMIMKLAESKGEMDEETLKQYLADDVHLHMYNFGHGNLLPKTEFRGVQEIRQGLQPFKRAFAQSGCVRSAQYSLCNSRIKILQASERNVVVTMILGGADLYLPRFVIGNYTFNNQDKLQGIELISSESYHPWQFMKPRRHRVKPHEEEVDA